MALELKGLKDKALAARRNIDRLHRAYDGFNEAAPAHAKDVEGIAGDIEAMTDDLTAAARILGNSANGSEAGATETAAEKPKPPPATEPPPAETNSQAPAASPPAVGQDATFQEGADHAV